MSQRLPCPSMRVVLALAALLLAGCAEPLFPEKETVEPAGSAELVQAIHAAWNERFTTDATEGWRFDAERSQRVISDGQPAPAGARQFVAALPTLDHVSSLQGRADWEHIKQALAVDGFEVHPDGAELQRWVSRGASSPERLDDGALDGHAPSWQGTAQVQWDDEAQDTWHWTFHEAFRWSASAYGSQVGQCPVRSIEASWLDADEALAIAMQQPDFASARATAPGGQLWLRLENQVPPHWDLSFDDFLRCAPVEDPRWMVRWVDLDRIEEGAPHVDVLVNAIDGAVDSVRHGLFLPRDAYTWQTLLSEQTLAVQVPGTTWTFDVPEGQVALDVDITAPPVAPAGISTNDRVFFLTDPLGHTTEMHEFVWSWDVRLPFPAPGTWSLESQGIGLDTNGPIQEITVRSTGL